MPNPQANFFNSTQCCDVVALSEYITTHSVEEMQREIEASSCDPNDMLCIGDMAFFQLKKPAYASLVYRIGLLTLQMNPKLIAPDIDMVKAAHNFAAVELTEGRIDNALMLLNAEPRIIYYNPNMGVDLAYRLISGGRRQEARPLLQRVLAIPMNELSEKLTYPLMVVRKLFDSSM